MRACATSEMTYGVCGEDGPDRSESSRHKSDKGKKTILPIDGSIGREMVGRRAERKN
jgi:hypothetical protein